MILNKHLNLIQVLVLADIKIQVLNQIVQLKFDHLTWSSS